jgi:hypothetical protein
MTSASHLPLSLCSEILLEDGDVSGRFDGLKNQLIICKEFYRRTDGIWEVVNESQE